VTEKKIPHHSLDAIKAAFSDPRKLNRTMSAAQGAEGLGMDETAVVKVIGVLTRKDFDKSMTSFADHKNWQDVYKPVVDGRMIYVKFTLDSEGELLLISFKEQSP